MPCYRFTSFYHLIWLLTLLLMGSCGEAPTPADNESPQALFTATPTEGRAPLTVAFDASASVDADGDIVRYVWDFGDGSKGSGVTASHVYTSADRYEARLSVFDNLGATADSQTTITVGAPRPAPTAAFSATPTQGAAPLTVLFDASESDASDGTLSYSWDFGDGGMGEGVQVQHTFAEAGTFTVTLTVTDDLGAQATAMKDITVEPGLEPLAVSPDGRGFLQSGEPFLWLGDTAWLLYTAMTQEQVAFYLDDAKAKGFNVVQTFLTADWRTNPYGSNGENLFGEAPFLDNDPTRLNPAYFDRVAQAVDAATERGLYVSIAFGQPGKATQDGLSFGLDNKEDAYVYARAVGERLREPTLNHTLIWVNGQDRNPDRDYGVEVWEALAEGLADGVNGVNNFDGQADYSTTLMSYHPDGDYQDHGWSSSTWFQDAAWLDFNAVNVFINYYHLVGLVATDVAESLPKPTVCLEPSYENHNRDNELRTDWHVRFQGYWCILSGAAGYAYGHDNGFRLAASTKAPWPEVLDSAGRLDMAHLKSVITSRPFGKLVSDQSLVVSAQGVPDEGKDYVAAARGDDGSYAFVYSTNGRAFSLDLTKLAGTRAVAQWFDPRHGAYQDAGSFALSSAQTFDPPGEPGDGNDWLLVVDSSS